MISIPQSTSFVFVFRALLASDHVTPATGKTIAMTISKAGGAFGNPHAGATNAAEISSGWYKVTLDTTDTGALGIIAIRGAVATIDDVGGWVFVVKATNGGLTALPDGAVTSNASLDTQLSAIYNNLRSMPPEVIPRNTAIRVAFHAYLSSDHISPATGKTITIQISKNGAALVNPAAGATTATEIGSGAYYVDLTAADVDTLGPLVVVGTAALTDTITVFYDVVVPSTSAAETSTIAPSGTAFITPLDIGNRALQHCGAERMDASEGFTEDSKNAREVSFCYNKLRQAELRRNVWRSAIRNTALRAIDTDTMLLAPSLWVSTTTYFAGSVVADQNGTAWISRIPGNLGNDPLNSVTWEQYFGPLTVMPYDDTTSYSAGELVYTTPGRGTNRVYLSLQNGNEDDPSTATAWSATDTYSKDQVIVYSAIAYMSKIDLNTNQTPSASAADWAAGTTYSISAAVNGSDGVTYTSVAGGNIGHDPISDGGVHWTNTGNLTAWTTVFTGGTGSLKWLQIGGAEFPMGVSLATLNIMYPIGSGPSSQETTRNVYRLPAGFLRKAPSDPKAGATSISGAPGNLLATDWRFVGNYIVSSQTDPLILWFVADTVDVAQWDPMFCEGLALRIAIEVCEPLTQSSEKLRTIAAKYKEFMTEARIVNGIETGSEEPALDDYLATRG